MENMRFFQDWLVTRPKMETHEPNVYHTILGGVSRGFRSPFLDLAAQSAIFRTWKRALLAKVLIFKCKKIAIEWVVLRLAIGITGFSKVFGTMERWSGLAQWGTHQKCWSQIVWIWKQIGDAVVWPVTICAALVSAASKCATVVIRCEGRIRQRRDPCYERHEMSTLPALSARLQLCSYLPLLLTNLQIYWSLNCLFYQSQWQYFQTGAGRTSEDRQEFGFSRSLGLRGFQIFKDTGFSQLLDRYYCVFMALL